MTGRRHPCDARLRPVLALAIIGWGSVRLDLHGARHGRREARALHRRLVEMGRCVRSRHRPGPSALLVVGVAAGLAVYGRPLAPVYATMVLWAIVGGYVASAPDRRAVHRRFGGMHIHVWRKVDSLVPADHRAAQPQHGDPRRRTARRTARQRARARRLVDHRQPDLPRRAATPRRASVPRGANNPILARRVKYTAVVLAGSRPGRDAFARKVRHGPEGVDSGRRRTDGATPGARAARKRMRSARSSC